MNTWTTGSGRFLEDGPKYTIREVDRGYTTHMSLNISNVETQDLGLYSCVSRNALGQATGQLSVYGECRLNFSVPRYLGSGTVLINNY